MYLYVAMSEPDSLCLAGVTQQAARVMHEWTRAHEIVDLWTQAAAATPVQSVFTPLLAYHQVLVRVLWEHTDSKQARGQLGHHWGSITLEHCPNSNWSLCGTK